MPTQNPIPLPLSTTIHFKNVEELLRLQKALLGLLNRVEVDACDEEQRRDLCRVYELLGHLMLPTGKIDSF